MNLFTTLIIYSLYAWGGDDFPLTFLSASVDNALDTINDKQWYVYLDKKNLVDNSL
jgi:hypothetical protein